MIDSTSMVGRTAAAVFGASRPIDWCDTRTYAYTPALTRDGWAWEFLRRNPDYRAAWADAWGAVRRVAAPAARFGLIAFEDPDRTAVEARCVWRSDASCLVLPVWAEHRRMSLGAVPQDLTALCARAALHLTDGAVQHVLFAEEGRRLQLLVQGEMLLDPVFLITDCLFTRSTLGRRLLLLRRLSDFTVQGHLAPALYPPEPRARRMRTVLRALDGWRARASHREIADVVFDHQDVAAEWVRSTKSLKQAVRRAVTCGRAFMAGGYLSLLK